jgi:hypothetical protein
LNRVVFLIDGFNLFITFFPNLNVPILTDRATGKIHEFSFLQMHTFCCIVYYEIIYLFRTTA